LEAASSDADEDAPALTPEAAARVQFRPSETAELSKGNFEAEIGVPGAALLAASLRDAVDSTERVAKYVDGYAVAQL